MTVETIQNVAFQMPMTLARRLDAYVDQERNGAPVGNVNRSSVIRAALAAFLEGVPDPKDTAPVARMSAGRPETMKGRPRRKPAAAPAPASIRTRTRLAPVAPAAE